MSYFKQVSFALVLLATPLLTGTASSQSYFDIRMSVGDIHAYLQNRMPSRSSAELRSLANLLALLCHENGFSPATVLSLVSAESGFDANVVSAAGAIGLMQLMPETARYIARRNGIYYRSDVELKNPKINLIVGVHYLAYLRDQFASSDSYLAAYNMGPAKYRRLQLKFVASGDAPGKVRHYVRSIQQGMLGIQQDAIRMRVAQGQAA
ncbi:MAG: lytic transglycosylase domain-containing protein [Oligoflexia bacterium]|nr:lytic transglycosylase domain-containing protein [Oligoflexia bacterium]